MIIGITTTQTIEQQEEGNVCVERVTLEYLERIVTAGAVPLLLPPLNLTQEANEQAAREIIKRIDGLILSGGGDILPSLYGNQEQLPQTNTIFEMRDALELELARAAHVCHIPTLGICRGMQVMNVALGGTLHQDIVSCGLSSLCHQQKPPYTSTTQCVTVRPDSVLTEALTRGLGAEGPFDINVNSMHHQAIETLADPLMVCATSKDGLIEGIEDPCHAFYVGVQWHPEYLDGQANLFYALVDAAREISEHHR